jgi:hypothetical protein
MDDAGVKPLTSAELKLLESLLSRASLLQSPHAPEVRIGEPYIALVNLSLPRRGSALADVKDRQVDLVRRGEVVYLTDVEARLFLRCDPDRDGRQVPVIQKLHGPDSRSEQPFILPRLMSGRQFGPPVHARPDPRGSSHVQELAPAIPEATPPQPGTENVPQVNAQDIKPGTAVVSPAGDVDRDLVAAAKSQMMMPGKVG